MICGNMILKIIYGRQKQILLKVHFGILLDLQLEIWAILRQITLEVFGNIIHRLTHGQKEPIILDQ